MSSRFSVQADASFRQYFFKILLLFSSNRVIMTMPNKFYNAIDRDFLPFLKGRIIPFFRHANSCVNLVKTQIPSSIVQSNPYQLHEFVWRQSELAFFGALASVDALFILLIFWRK